jgi:tetratricopeptide (TPR) repeat protein
MSTPQRTIKVFIASPGDLAIERRAFKEVIDELNKGYGRGAKVTFEPLGWEDALAQVGRRSQSLINKDIDDCDVFVLVMWRRWGQPAPDAAPLTSYTEEEFYRALARYEKDGKPTIFVFFKHIDPGQMADPGPELAKVLAFRRKLEETRRVLYRGFPDERAFRLEIDTHLTAFADGKCEIVDGDRALPIIPDTIQAELEKHRDAAQRGLAELEQLRGEAERAKQEAEQARAEAKGAIEKADASARAAEAGSAARLLMLAQDAAKAALEGRIEEARQGFAMALDGTTNTKVLFLGFQFYRRIGELDEAERLLRRSLAISGPNSETESTADAYGNLGVIMEARGDLEGAEAMHHKALELDEKARRLQGMAIEYGNLGVILRTRGNLEGAEAMYRKALEINEKLGRREGVAIQYNNLGLIMKARGDLEGAEAMHRRALELDEQFGPLEATASEHGNLGLMLQTHGVCDAADAAYLNSLVIDERHRRLERTVREYENLGFLLLTRGDPEEAEGMFRKALEIEETFGRLEGVATQYSNLGLVQRIQSLIGELRK